MSVETTAQQAANAIGKYLVVGMTENGWTGWWPFSMVEDAVWFCNEADHNMTILNVVAPAGARTVEKEERPRWVVV